MATLVFGAIGYAIGGAIATGWFGATAATATTAASWGAIAGATIGLAAGSYVGGYIDQTYLYPLLQDQKGVKGPRIDDLPIQTASEGSPMHFALGRENRIAGTIIWLSDLIELKKEDDVEGGKGGGGGAKQTSYEYYVHIAVGICEGPITNVRKIWADAKLIYDDSLPEPKDRRVHLIRIYTGLNGHPQDADSIISSYEGLENTPGFRGTAYVVLEGLLLRDFGNRVPQFTFLVEVQTHESVAAGIFNILSRANLTQPEDFDMAGVEHSIRGYTMSGPTTPISCLEPIMQAYDVLTRENGPQIIFFTRGREDIVDIDPNDLVAIDGVGGDGGSGGPRPFLLNDPSGWDLPKEVNVRYIDPTHDYQNGNGKYTRGDADGTLVEQLDVPIVMHPSDANDIAANRLWRHYAERVKVSFSLPPKYFILQENDIARVQWEGETYSIRIMQSDIGNNGLIQIQGLLVDFTAAEEDYDCARRLSVAEEISPPQNVLPVILDTVAVREGDTVQPGFYAAAVAPHGQPNFTGGSVYQSMNGTDWNLVGNIPEEATVGTITNRYFYGTVDATDTIGVLDMVTEVDIMLQENTLESVTYTQLLNGANRAFLGKELIGFQTATLVGPNTYRLSNLLRGLRGTTASAHSEGERFMKISNFSTGFHPMNSGAIGTRRFLKIVQDGQNLDDTQTHTMVYEGNNLKQLPVCQFVPDRDPSTFDITLGWTRRTRAFTPAFAPYKPLGADEERYEVDVYLNTTVPTSFDTPIRTIKVSAPTLTYLKTEQDADTGGGYFGFYFKVYQINEQVGRGHPAGFPVF
jgi:hypothetical protein